MRHCSEANLLYIAFRWAKVENNWYISVPQVHCSEVGIIGLRAWSLFIHTQFNILNIFSNSIWKKDNNLPAKIKFLCHCHFINWEKSCTCRSSCRSTRVISAFIIHASRKSRAFIHAYTRTRKSYMVLAQLVYALLAGHKRYNDRLASNQKHPFIASMYEQSLKLTSKRYQFKVIQSIWQWLCLLHFLCRKLIPLPFLFNFF